MLTPEQVKTMIEKIIPCKEVIVEGDGHHFFAQIISAQFEGLSRLARHRLIKDALSQQIASNELHALSINKAITPEEWAKQQ